MKVLKFYVRNRGVRFIDVSVLLTCPFCRDVHFVHVSLYFRQQQYSRTLTITNNSACYEASCG